MIYEHVWGTSVAVDDNAIMVYINRLRARSKRTGRNRSILSQSEDWATVLFLRTGRWQE